MNNNYNWDETFRSLDEEIRAGYHDERSEDDEEEDDEL
jgi:hypothetical protein